MGLETFAQDSTHVQEENSSVGITYGDKGFEFQTSDHKYLLQIQSRLQFRYAFPADQNPLNLDDFEEENRNIFKINRARLKIGGHAFQPWLKYYWEYEVSQSNLLDFRVMLEKWPFFNVKAGQWKTEYNRERVISSGQQQMVDRSIINRPFTLDRQQGVAIYGRLQGGGMADFNYWFSVLTGNGRGAITNDDEHLMYVTRLQWNFTGNELEMTASDIDYHEELTGLLAIGAVTNRSPYTRFSQSGGGELEGFPIGEPGQYRVNQWVEETALMWRGFSWQQEFHWKQIRDEVNGTTTTMAGNYAQAGYFFHYLWDWVPPPLELAVRHAIYRPDLSQSNSLEQEIGLASNWFFHGHLNKLTMEATYFRFSDTALNLADGLRFRVQLDISF
jgi:phosphate-selective porin